MIRWLIHNPRILYCFTIILLYTIYSINTNVLLLDGESVYELDGRSVYIGDNMPGYETNNTGRLHEQRQYHA
jgi:hypothetical protein